MYIIYYINYTYQIDDSDVFFILRAIGDRNPRVRDAVRSDLSLPSLDFFPFFPPNSPPNIPFFFFFDSPDWATGDGDGNGLGDVVTGGSSTS
jgi:hypothetical protein